MRHRLFGSLVLVSSVSAIALALGCGTSGDSDDSDDAGDTRSDGATPTGSADASSGSDGGSSPTAEGGGGRAVTPPVSTCAPAKVTLGTPVTAKLTSSANSTANLATGDFNDDGASDVAVLASGEVDVFLSKKDGTFAAPVSILDRVGSGPAFVAADFSGDGIPDIVLSSFGMDTVDQSVDLIVSNGDGTFQPPVNYADQSTLLYSLHAADVNRDGKLDLVYDGQDSDGVLLNDGHGFASPGTAITLPVNMKTYDLADFDGDGAADIVYADVDKGACILRNDGSGTFGASTCFAGTAGSANNLAYAGDVNGDGKMDAVTVYDGHSGANGAPTIGVYFGKGDGTLGTVAGITAFAMLDGAVLVDANNDGKLDIALYDGTSVTILPNDGTGAFTAMPAVYALSNDSSDGPLTTGDFRANGLRGFAALDDVAVGIDVASATCAN
jgi:hypothetical protein